MHSLRFTTDNPLDHLPRALDQLRRMGFELQRAAVEGSGARRARVRVVFAALADGAAETFRHRVEGLPGVADVRLREVRRTGRPVVQ